MVGITAGSQVDSFFAMTYQNALVGHGDLFLVEQSWAIGHITDDGRNTIVSQALKGDFDYVFFMDSDMLFPKATLAKLLRSLSEIETDAPPIIGGLYNTRGDHRVNAYKWEEEQHAFKPEYYELNSGVYKVDAVATGCLLIDCGVFDVLPFPWFEYKYWPGPGKKKIERWSEDIVFAKYCMDAGIPHYLDTGVVCKHLHSVAIVQSDKTSYQIEKMDGELYETVDFSNGMVTKTQY